MSAAPKTSTGLRKALLSEAVVPVAGIVYAVALVWTTWGLPQESTIFPRTMFCALVILGILLMLAEIKLASGPPKPVDHRAYAMLGLSLAFVLVMSFVGYLPAAMLFLLISLIALKQRLVVAISIAIGLPGVIYALFTVAFGISL